MFSKKINHFFDLSTSFSKFISSLSNLRGASKREKLNSLDMITQLSTLSNQLNTDELTNLFNRRRFFTDINRKIDGFVASKETPFFIVFIDLDGFKTINDELGHSAGDIVLKEYSKRLIDHSETSLNSIYRMGGDEFVILFEDNAQTKDDIIRITSQILQLTEAPFKIKDKTRCLSQSIGIAPYKKGATAEEFLIFADTAMYEAKRLGKNRAIYYSEELHTKITQRNEIIRLLKNAINEKEFHLVFQAQMIKTPQGYEKKGAEILMRWVNKELGVVSPDVFIPIAEEAGLMGMIDDWLIEEVGQQISQLKQNGIEHIFSINISAKQFSNVNLPDNFKETLKKYNIPPESIIIEITESATLKEPELTKNILRKFRKYGFGISIDDFGTGYSSISYLRQFPVTEIKFDRSFTRNISIDEQDEIIMSGLCNIARQLHLDIVIEGVENEEQVSWIESHLSNAIIQGYFFSKPLRVEEFITFSKALTTEI